MRRKNGAEGIKLADFRLYLKTTVIESMVLAQKQKYRPIEQDRKPRNKHVPIGILFLTNEARIYNGAKTTSSINGAGKTGQLSVKE